MASFTERFTYKAPEIPPITARKVSSGSPLDWILESKSPVLADTINELRNSSLPQKLVELFASMEEKSGDADCIKLLLCKTSPLIWGMQRACNDSFEPDEQIDESDEHSGKGLNSFFKYLPDMQEFSCHGDACESRYKECKILPVK